MAGITVRQSLVLLVVVLLSACAVMQQLVTPPRVSVTGMRIAQLGLFEQVLEFDLELDNSNAFALPLAGMNYTLEVAGIELGRGSQSEPITLPANGQARWPVSFKVNSLNLIQGLMEHGEFTDMDYRISGNFIVSKSANIPPIPFDKSGRIGR